MTFFRSEVLNVRFFIVLVLTALFVFLTASGSFCSEPEERYYTACVASYKRFTNAAALRDRLKAQGYDSFCETVNLRKKGKWHRVLIGKYKNKSEAISAGMEAEARGGREINSVVILRRTAPSEKRDTEDKEDPGLAPAVEKREPAVIPALAEKETPAAPASTEEKSTPANTEEIALSHKVRAPEAPPVSRVNSKSYDTALTDFNAGRYKEALGKFKKIIKTEESEAPLRRIADCYYYLGKGGNDSYFWKAIDQYRNVIRDYPDSERENAQSLYRLAISYDRVNLYYEGLMESENLCSRYPGSDYALKSLYLAGKMLYKTERFKEAISKFKEYIHKFPDGKNVRDAYFSVGDCYSRMCQFNDADVWYGDALEKWPALEDISEEALLNMGSHYSHVGNYDESLRVLFVYLNMFPDSKQCGNALYMIARSFEGMGQLPLALKAFSLVVGRYPGSREAQKSALTMAHIGVSYPGIKVPTYILPGMDYYESPIESYDRIEKEISDLNMKEELVFRKGNALAKSGRHREAYDNYRVLLDTFPYGAYRNESEENLVLSARHLIDDYYSKEDYTAVAGIYFNSDKNVLFGDGDFDTLFKVGNSLKKMGLSDHASGFFEEMINMFKEDRRRNEIVLAAAGVDYDRKQYDNAKKRLNGLLKEASETDEKTVAMAAELMGDISSKEGFFKKAAGFYSEVLDSRAGIEDIVAVRKKYADSLREIGCYSSALISYERVLKECGGTSEKCSVPVVLSSYEGAGDCLYGKGQYRKAVMMYEKSVKGVPDGKQNIWTTINMARGYANLDNAPMSDKLFSSLKGESGDEFWSRVAEYYAAGSGHAGQ